jgi:hypothetical protein
MQRELNDKIAKMVQEKMKAEVEMKVKMAESEKQIARLK